MRHCTHPTRTLGLLALVEVIRLPVETQGRAFYGKTATMGGLPEMAGPWRAGPASIVLPSVPL
jgi:hypothetical protein